MNYILLIWEMLEGNEIYLIPTDVSDKFINFLEKSHNKYICADDWESNEALHFMNAAIGNISSSGFEEYLGIFVQYKVNINKPIYGKEIEAVFVSGFLM